MKCKPEVECNPLKSSSTNELLLQGTSGSRLAKKGDTQLQRAICL